MRLKDSRPDKYFPTPPVEPGSESGFKLRPGLEALRQAELCLGNLCCALNEVTTFMVFDHRFAPREYLRYVLKFRVLCVVLLTRCWHFISLFNLKVTPLQ